MNDDDAPDPEPSPLPVFERLGRQLGIATIIVRMQAVLASLAIGPILTAWSNETDKVWEPFLLEDDPPGSAGWA